MKVLFFKMIAVVFILGVLPVTLLSQGGNGLGNLNNKMNVTSFNVFLQGATVELGHYVLQRDNDLVCVKMMDFTSRNKQHYLIENCFETVEIIESNDGFSSVNRKAGVLKFQNFDTSTGQFTFTKNPEFVEFLENQDIELNNDPYYFKLFLGGIDEAYILDIKDLGFDPSITELGRLVWHDASVAYIEDMSELFPNFNLDDISMLSAHNVSIDYLYEFGALGIETMDMHSIKKAKSKNITPRMIKAEKRRGNNFTDLRSYIKLLKGK